MKKWLIFILICLLIMPSAVAFERKEDMRAAYQALGMFPGDTPYTLAPRVSAPYDAGELNELALDEALDYLNFLRALADLEPVERSRIYDYQCQRGAVLLAALDYVDHNAPAAPDMDPNFYDSAHLATMSSNIAKFNWMRPTILREGIAYFARDDGDANLPVLGHRRWLLNPYMNATGFGLANSESGMSYVAMYAHDQGRPNAEWSEICWPTQGVFPVELMHGHLAWSVSLNPAVYDVASSRIRATLAEENLGLEYNFDCSAGNGDGFCTVNVENYGSGPCVIFRPAFDEDIFTDYEQNQVWKVKLTGLVKTDGTEETLEYQVSMASLYIQEAVNVEMSQLETEMKSGDSMTLTAKVIPDYADDQSVSWTTSDPFVATVDDCGNVTAIAPGACEIIAVTANNRSDTCQITVTE